MSISAIEIEIPLVVDVHVTEDTLFVELSDGRTISVPLGWFPRLEEATEQEKRNWGLIGKGHGIHWEDIDEILALKVLSPGNHRLKASYRSSSGFKRDKLAQQWADRSKVNPRSCD